MVAHKTKAGIPSIGIEMMGSNGKPKTIEEIERAVIEVAVTVCGRSATEVARGWALADLRCIEN